MFGCVTIDSREGAGEVANMSSAIARHALHTLSALVLMAGVVRANVGQVKVQAPVVLSPIEGASTLSLRLVIQVGCGDESRRSAGQSAATLAWLRRGPSERMGPGELERRAHQSGLSVQGDISWNSTSLTLSGPASLAWHAGDLLAGRLSPGDLSDAGVDALRDALWIDAEASMAGVVGPMGNLINTAVSAIEGGRTPFSSRMAAQRLAAKDFRRFARVNLRERPAFLVIAGPPGAIEEAQRAFMAKVGRQFGAHVARPAAALKEGRRFDHQAFVPLTQSDDSLHHVALAWSQRGLAKELGLTLHQRDAVLLAMQGWLAHPGGPVSKHAVFAHGALDEFEVTMVEHDASVLVLSGATSAEHASDARRELLQTIDALAGSGTRGLVLGAEVVGHVLRERYATPVGRTRLIAELIDTGRARDAEGVDTWLKLVQGALGTLDGEWGAIYLSRALAKDRRLIAAAEPSQRPKTHRLKKGPAELDTYLRILVDLQCPGASYPSSVGELLQRKYQMTARAYADRTRAIARDRRIMRSLVEDAEFRCLELKRLRKLMPERRVVELFEAVVCGPGATPKSPAGQKALARIHARFRIDPSWYRPLVLMARESPPHQQAIEAVERRCHSNQGERQ